jgi:tRNA(Ile)-lysidine synthase
MIKSFINQLDSFLSHLSGSRIAVAVSGGADSLSLCLILHDWAKTHGLSLTALTVDHQLRSESSQEANQVHEWLSESGIHHEILIWEHDSINTNLQERAREARYSLLLDYCNRHKIHNLFVGHHVYDQWETFFMRLSHSSGLKGLAGMNAITTRQNINIFRPFLTILPEILKQYLLDKNHPWIEDISNTMKQYERVRWRHQQSHLVQLGLTPEVINKTCIKLEEEDKALDWSVVYWMQSNTMFDATLKFVKVNLNLKTLPKALVKRIMKAIASKVRGIDIHAKDVRHDMEAPYNKLCASSCKPFTFGGCYWFEYNNKLYSVREWQECPTEMITHSNMVYDHRFTLTNLPLNEKIIPVGKEHWAKVKLYVKELHLPYQVFLSLPIVIKNNEVVWLGVYNIS